MATKKRPASVRTLSRLERKFELLWRTVDGPALQPEFRFHPTRKWRADYAHLESRTLIELEGGVWVGGRHNRAAGFVADAEKYLEAALGGWRVVRLVSSQLTLETVGRVAAAVRCGWSTTRTPRPTSAPPIRLDGGRGVSAPQDQAEKIDLVGR
jgi:very-short-patch-repair endonuclease